MRLRLAVAMLALLLLAGTGAQQVRAQGVSAYLGSPKDSYKVLVVGDTLAPGLMLGLQRLAAGDLRLSVDGRYKDDSGLVRPEFQDWAQALPRSLDANPADIVVICLGSNDAQPLREGTAAYALNSPQWQAAYGARVDRLLAAMTARGVAVYWIGLPPMADPALDAGITAIAAVQKARVAAAGFRYVDLRPAFADAAGRFVMQGPDETGMIHRLRDSDGLHFTKAGNNRAGQILLTALRADIAAADGAKPAAAAGAQGQAPSTPAKAPLTPLFGQARLVEGGEEVTTVRPEFMPPSAPVAVAEVAVQAAMPTAVPTRQVVQESGLTGAALMAELARGAAPGSAAAALFTTGAPPAPRAGRLDDFAAP